MSDEIVNSEKKKVFFIRHPNGPLDNIEKFLNQRDFVAYSAPDLKEAFAGIIKFQPDYVFVCLDHPNEKIASIPKLLLQSFPVRVIPYVHGTAMLSIRLIQNSPAEYKLFPPNSAPSVLRLLNKIARDVANGGSVQADPKDRGQIINTGRLSAGDSKMVHIDGSQTQKSSWSTALESGKNADQFLINQGDDSSWKNAEVQGGYNALSGNPQASGSAPSDSNTFYPTSQNSSSNPNAAGFLQGSQQTPGNSVAGGGLPNGMNSMTGQANAQGHAGMYNPSGQNPNAMHGLSNSNPAQSGMNGFGNPTGANLNTSSSTNNASVMNGLNARQNNPATGANGVGKAADRLAKSTSANENAKPLEKTKSLATRASAQRAATSSFEDGLEDSLRSISSSHFAEGGIKKIARVSSATCFAIDSPKFTGYLVAVFAGKKKFDSKFLDLMQKRLREFLLSRGETLDPSEKMDIEIVEVDFQEWAIEQAEFLKKSVHDGNEVAMAFFPTQHPRLVELRPSENKDMLKISIDDIDETRAVKFNVYIYLAANQRYILYTPKGGRMAREQKVRLKKKGVSDLHFHKNEAHDFKTYQAEKYLDGRILEMQANEKAEAEAKKKARAVSASVTKLKKSA